MQGPTEQLTAADVIAADGPRVPDVATSQKSFRVATVLVSKFRPLNDDEMAFFDYFAARGEGTEEIPYSEGFGGGVARPFKLATRGIGTLDAKLFDSGDADCDGTVNSIDAALVLQFTARLLQSLRCLDGADTDHNRAINSIDATLVLQFVSGLLHDLPI